MACLHPLAGQRDDALHEHAPRRAVGVVHPLALAVRVQHDDVAALRPLDRVPEARGQQPVAREQRARHRVGRHAEDSDHESLDAIGDQESEQERQRELDERASAQDRHC